jgi:diguanylate cyclase (GGDEF)-like protein
MTSRSEDWFEQLMPRRVLIASDGSDEARLRDLFLKNLSGEWQPALANSFEQAQFVLQHSPCDVVLVDEGLCQREGAEGLSWLGSQTKAPLAFLSSESPAALTEALRQGVDFCLPRTLALGNPQLLSAALDRVAQLGRVRASAQKTGAELDEARRQVDRLVQLLWQAAPLDPRTHWYTQHYMLERLFEEIARTGRHGAPLTVAVGEIESGGPSDDAPDALPNWAVRQITQKKRRCDVAGQYGPKGFLLLMVQTSKEGGLSCCRRLRQEVQQAPEREGKPVRAYFGVASFSAESCTPQSILRAAEEQLDKAREGYGEEGVAG